jgi:tRNA threonylcarbamoyladenosine biosynthesis protein TsaB
MTYFLSVQNNYEAIEIALFRDGQLLATAQEDKIRASKSFIRILDFILKDNNVVFNELSFIAVNQGPGPFTTLRVVIASVNGLSFSSHIPLIGIDGIDALFLENPDDNAPITVALLNAFNNDVYYGIQDHGKIGPKGSKNIDIFLEELKNMYPNAPIRFIGNGGLIFAKQIEMHYGNNAIIPMPLPSYCSVKHIGLMGWERWQKQENLAVKLMPLYLKQTIIPPAAKTSE